MSAAVPVGAQPYPTGDLNADRDVDFADLQIFAADWLNESCPVIGCEGDLDGTNGVDIADFAMFAENWREQGTTAIISEFMASNGSSEPLGLGELLDEDGDSSDWIEIHNPTDDAIDLSRWYLTEDAGDLTMWQFPDKTVLGPGEFLVVFASGKDRTGLQLHTNFRLGTDPAYLALVESNGVTIAYEYAPYPKQLTDISYGLAQHAVTLVPSGANVSYRVPTIADAGINWIARTFDDSAWDTGQTGLGFGSPSAESGQDIGSPAIAGSHLVQGNVYIVNGDGADIWGTSDSFYYLYAPLSGDGELSARVMAVTNTNSWAKAGPMIRETLSAGSKHAMQVMTPGNGAAFQYRSSTGGSSETIHGGAIAAPYWVRIVRQGSILSGYHSPDGINWIQQGAKVIPMADDVYIGFCVCSHASGTLCSAVFDNVRFGSEVTSDLKDKMLGVNTSLWMRIEFEGEEVDSLDSMTLRMKYDDGFVAYLNGVKVAGDNFTGTPDWNSAADSDRPNALAGQLVSFDISEHVDKLHEGSNVLAVHAVNDNKADEEFRISPELLAAGSVAVPQYFAGATPGQYNIAGAISIVGDTKFSHDRGFYDAPFYLTITTETAGATIRYTTDGSAPSATSGREYAGPIYINTTTCLRAVAVKPGWMPSNVDAQTYIFLDKVIRQPKSPTGFPSSWGSTAADYEMDPDVVNDARYRNRMKESLLSIPTVSIVTELSNLFGPSGIYDNSTLPGVAWERPASIEWINPDGTTGFQVNAGLRIYGGDPFRGMNLTRKKSFRLFFKRLYGPTKLNFRMFDAEDAATSFDTIVLRAGANDGWNNWGGANSQYIVDEFMRRTQLAFGQVSPHGTYVHLYLNGLYWGLYNPVERPMASFCATYYGGDKEEWDALNSGTPTGESSTATWNAMLSQVAAGLSDNASYQKIQGNNSDGEKNPDYDNLLDVDNYIDWLLSNFWGGTGDWPYHNFFAGCRRPPDATGFKFFNWDAEGAIVIWSSLGANVTGVSDGGARPYVALRQNDEFRLRFADHAHRHLFNNGAATSEVCYARYKQMADTVEPAIIAESARWGDQASAAPHTLAAWQSSRDYILGTYMPQRPAIVLSQLKGAGLYPAVDAPSFLVNGGPQHGGHASKDDLLMMSATSGQIYYCLDGNDPHLPVVVEVTGTTLVPENAGKRAFVPAGDIGATWRTDLGFNDSAWAFSSGSPGGVGYERGSGYGSYISIDLEGQMYNGNTSCYIRVPFTVDAADLASFNFMTLQMRYDDGFIAYINGVEVAKSNAPSAPQWNSSATAQNSDSAAVNLQSFEISDYVGELRPGQNLLAIQGLNISTTSSDLLISAKLIAGQSTAVGEILSASAIEYTGPVMLSQSIHVRARTLRGSSWSALNEATFAVGPVAEGLRITEMMYHPQFRGDPNDQAAEYVELTNIGAETINLNLVRFTNGVDFTFPDIELLPDQYVLVVKDIEAFAAKYGPGYDIAGQYTGSLNNNGERVELQDAAGTTIHNFRYRDGWYDITDGLGFSLTVKDPANTDPNQWGDKATWRPSADIDGSPGADDTGQIPELGDVVINELLAHSHAAASDWVELHNTTDHTVNIGGWFLSDDAYDLKKYKIAEGRTIRAAGYVVFTEDLHFGNLSDPGCSVPFALSENGETLYLHSGQDGILTGYSEQEKFGPSETGVAFGRYRKSTGAYNFVAMSTNTPGTANAYPKVGPIVITEIMYHPAGLADAEYVELLNISDGEVTLYNFITEEPWRFTDDPDNPGIEFLFPSDPPVTLESGEYILMVKDPAVFGSAYTVPDGTSVFAWGAGRLDNGGEKVQISMPGDVDTEGVRQYIRVDRVRYSDGSHPDDFASGVDPWPTWADGLGMSLSRLSPQHYGNDPNNWQAAAPSPGAPNP